jgi:tetratricopeptide (TPR) repeat protein
LIGRVLLNRGDFKEALAKYEDAAKRRRAAAERDPGNDDCRLAAGPGEEKLGDYWFAVSDYSKARDHYETARRKYQELVDKDPTGDRADWRKPLVSVTSSLAQTYELEIYTDRE